MLLIIGIDLRLDVARHLRFIGKLHGFEEVRIDVGEIHLAEVEAREFVDRETGALSFLRSEEHTSELQSLMRISYAVFCLKKKKNHTYHTYNESQFNTNNKCMYSIYIYT